ncbi:MAG: peroxiredoxin-like family protein [Azospirillaceae bacterium]|nr:peroxiredoxin-like family protein [Azospirillaceae bacterium]
MSLPRQLRTLRDRLHRTLPAAAWASIEQLIAGLKASGIEQRAVRAGALAPRFVLANSRGRPVDLSERLARGAVALSFCRGVWCPYCDAELRALQAVAPQIRALGASLIALSPERRDGALDGIGNSALDFELLSDPGNQVARAFGLVFRLPAADQRFLASVGVDLVQRNGDASWELPVPATYLIGVDGIVRLAFVDADFRYRLDPVELVGALRCASAGHVCPAPALKAGRRR